MTCSPGPGSCSGRKLKQWTIAVAGLAHALAFPFAAQAQHCSDATVRGVNVKYIEDDTLIPKANSCNLLPCHKPEHTGTSGEEGELRVGLRFPGNHQFQTNNHVRFYWFNTPEPFPGNCLPPPHGNCSPIAVCGLLGAEILTDEGTAVLQVSCSAFAAAAGSKVFSISAYACQTFSGECTQRLDIPDLDVWNLACRTPPVCEDKCGCAYGGGTSGGPSGPGKPGAGGGATLRYRAGGVGEPAFPGAASWRVALGRYWSHDYAERIVLDPDTSHVWLITQHATFREFTDANGDGTYERNAPSDEYRRLRRVASGWELTDLEGGVQSFDAQGRWTRTQDTHGNAKIPFYSGDQLVRVDMPDGRSETFSYHPGGKLASLTEVGVDGSTSRTWSYNWSGDDLVRIDPPDGRAWLFRYADPRLPGYMTRSTLVGTDGSERVEGAWEYDAQGNLARRWKGDASPDGPAAVELTSYSYDNPYLPRQTRVTNALGKVATYTLGRDPVSHKPRAEAVAGECPSCGLAPNSQLFYEDPAHPLLKTREVDGDGTVTLYAYDADGRMTSRTEASGTPFQRTTRWEYGGPLPGLVTAIEWPSTSGTGTRRSLLTYDARGQLLTSTVQGTEAGAGFQHTTTYRYTAAGRLAATDPPGFGMSDETSFTYDPARGNLLPLTRTDPLVGTTLYSYDAWNRRAAVVDPNGLRTVAEYDLLDRVIRLTQEGGAPGEELVTLYEHNGLGDLVRTVLPRGNVIEHGYDGAGRLVSVERKADRSTAGERVLYTLDGDGHRTRKEHQHWDGSQWLTDSATAYSFASGCRLDQALHSDGSITEYAYDCEGNLERIWDANHPSDNRSNPATTTYEYDELDRLAAIRQPWAGAGGGDAVTRYEYDVQDHLAKVTDAEGNVTRLTTSDRDLVTAQTSPASGTTEYRYNEHGQLTTETDARGVAVRHTFDALDRRTFSDFPEDDLDTRFTWDDPLVSFSKGRITAIIRNGATVAYRYDRFGRVVQDGALTYEYDANGNRTKIGYPGDVAATYAYDFADREERVVLSEPSQPAKTLASGARYLADGPLSSLILGNGLAEIRTYDGRYAPTGIEVPGRIAWSYTTDAVGNVLAIQDALDPAQPRQYAYQDVAYFLTQGNGPWGNLSWTYDKIGNRLTESRNGAARAFAYPRNAAGGDSPQLATVIPPAPAPPATYHYDPASHQTARSAGEEKLRFTYNAERRLSRISRDQAGETPASTRLAYDGRGFLERARFFPDAGAGAQTETWPTYGTEGTLFHKFSQRVPAAAEPRGTVGENVDSYLFYLDAKPVAILERAVTSHLDGSVAERRRLLYLSTDHLGAPILATDEAGAPLWRGGTDPFGGDWNGALEAGVFLRLPGQWADRSWENARVSAGLSYNLYRWYEPGTGRYTKEDPLGISGQDLLDGPAHPYLYAAANPLLHVDPEGLVSVSPGQFSKRCERRWRDRVLPQLLAPSEECKDFFCRELKTNLDDLLASDMPLIVRKQGLGGIFYRDKDPQKIGLSSNLFCNRNPQRVMAAVLHELGHYADFHNNGDQFLPQSGALPHHDGCGAEIACVGKSVSEDCKRFGYPAFRGVRGDPGRPGPDLSDWLGGHVD